MKAISCNFPLLFSSDKYLSRRKWKYILWHFKRWTQFWKRSWWWWTCRRGCFTCRQCRSCILYQVYIMIHHVWDNASYILLHLQAISKEEPNCTLVTREGRRTEVKPFLLAIIFFKIFFNFWNMVFIFLTGAVIPPGSRQPVSCQHPLPSRHLVLSIYFPFSQFLQ